MSERKRRKFTAEQKTEAVRLVYEVGSIGQVAKDLDLTESALRNWVKQSEIDDGHGPEGALTTEEKEELRKLRRENKTLRMERDFPRKPRPSSPRTAISVRADRSGEGAVPHLSDVQGTRCLEERAVRLASAAPYKYARSG